MEKGYVRLSSVVVVLSGDVSSVMLIGAWLRAIGNSYKLVKIVGGTFMETIETKIKSFSKTNFVMETLLVVGNLGASIANHRLGTE